MSVLLADKIILLLVVIFKSSELIQRFPGNFDGDSNLQSLRQRFGLGVKVSYQGKLYYLVYNRIIALTDIKIDLIKTSLSRVTDINSAKYNQSLFLFRLVIISYKNQQSYTNYLLTQSLKLIDEYNRSSISLLVGKDAPIQEQELVNKR